MLNTNSNSKPISRNILLILGAIISVVALVINGWYVPHIKNLKIDNSDKIAEIDRFFEETNPILIDARLQNIASNILNYSQANIKHYKPLDVDQERDHNDILDGSKNYKTNAIVNYYKIFNKVDPITKEQKNLLAGYEQAKYSKKLFNEIDSKLYLSVDKYNEIRKVKVETRKKYWKKKLKLDKAENIWSFIGITFQAIGILIFLLKDILEQKSDKDIGLNEGIK